MLISEHWLRTWVSPELDTAGLVHCLTMAGLEVDSVSRAGPELERVVVGRIVSVAPHPEADRLRVCAVDVGRGERLQIVCGADNARPGLRAPTALTGARLPSGTVIEKTRLRGVESVGMLCSATELGFEEASEGLMELDDDARPGQSVARYLRLDDAVIDIDLTPNRGDCLSVLGVARELSALTGAPLLQRDIEGWPNETHERIDVAVARPDWCPRYVARVVSDLEPGARTPIWMRERLRRCGVRPIHPVVDITNYVMLELGQPMHAFDASRVAGGIVVRTARDGESLLMLDGTEQVLSNDALIIADHTKPLALAGIMGGEESAVAPATNRVILEAAFFASAAVANKGRALGLQTDSSHRFERGVDPALPVVASHYASALLHRIANGRPGPIVERSDRSHLPHRRPVILRYQQLLRVLGCPLTARDAERALKRISRRVRRDRAGWRVEPPSYRFDIERECDLIEEVARVRGYDQVPAKRPAMIITARMPAEARVPVARVRAALVDRDYREIITYSFVDPQFERLLQGDGDAIALANPLAANMSVMRTSLWSGLLPVLIANRRRQHRRIRLFELGRTFHGGAGAVTEVERVGGVVCGPAYAEQWGLPERAVDFFDVKADVELLAKLTGGEKSFTFKTLDHPSLHPGQAAEIMRAGRRVGMLGRLHPRVQSELDLEESVVLFELELDSVRGGVLPRYAGISRFPAIRRDLAIMVNNEVGAGTVLECVRETAGEHLVDLELFDVYRPEGIDLGEKSLAFRLTLQASSRTLTDTEVDAIIERTLTVLGRRFGARLRT